MQFRKLTLGAALALAVAAADLSAQQGPHAGAGLGTASSASANHGIGRGNSSVGTSVGAQFGSTGALPAASSVGANQGIGPRPDVATARGEGALRSVGRGNSSAGTSVGAQFGSTGTMPAAAAAAGAGNGNGNGNGKTRLDATSAVDSRAGLSMHARGRADMAARVSGQERVSGRERSSNTPATTVADDTKVRGSAIVAAGTGTPWDRSGMTRADWLLAKRLASIDRMRDIALQNGNERQLTQADKLEAVARQQHQRRTGEFADATATTDTNVVPANSTSESTTETSETSAESTTK